MKSAVLLQQKLDSYLSRHHLKSTKQRDVIVEAFFASSGRHMTIEDLLKDVRKKNEAIGYATVYRTLNLLVAAGVAHQRHFHDGQSRFEIVSAHHHDHLICTQCGEIVEFENDAIERLQDEVARKHKFTLTGHKLELYGVCQNCRST